MHLFKIRSNKNETIGDYKHKTMHQLHFFSPQQFYEMNCTGWSKSKLHPSFHGKLHSLNGVTEIIQYVNMTVAQLIIQQQLYLWFNIAMEILLSIQISFNWHHHMRFAC